MDVGVGDGDGDGEDELDDSAISSSSTTGRGDSIDFELFFSSNSLDRLDGRDSLSFVSRSSSIVGNDGTELVSGGGLTGDGQATFGDGSSTIASLTSGTSIGRFRGLPRGNFGLTCGVATRCFDGVETAGDEAPVFDMSDLCSTLGVLALVDLTVDGSALTTTGSPTSTWRRFLGRSQSLLQDSSSSSSSIAGALRRWCAISDFFSTSALGSAFRLCCGLALNRGSTLDVFFSTGFFLIVLRAALRPRFLTAETAGSSLISAMLVGAMNDSPAVSDIMLGSSSLATAELPTKGDHRNASGSNSSRNLLAATRSAYDFTIFQSMHKMTLFKFK